MKKELLFYNQIEFDSTKEMFHALGYEIISLSLFIDHIKNVNELTQYKKGVYVIDISVLGGYNQNSIQLVGEGVFKRLSNEEFIYVIIYIFTLKIKFCLIKINPEDINLLDYRKMPIFASPHN